jgi:tRNA 2-selenouridine synthase
MSEYFLDIKEFMSRSRSLPVIDVRSPAEFDHAHIPGAGNLPLFSNDERSVIGTIYLQRGSSDAMTQGLEFIRPRLQAVVAAGNELAPDGEALMHCWRGGMRSSSMAWLFNSVGIKTSILSGGYKQYRSFVRDFFKMPFKLVVVGGMTGSGKTKVLEAIELQGKQVVHLERLASHKGSVFGGIGMPLQPSAEQFENELSGKLSLLDPSQPVFIEDESIAIGNVFIPKDFYAQMTDSLLIKLSIPHERRVQLLLEEYTACNPEFLIQAVMRLERRLGLVTANRIIEYIGNFKMEEAISLILKYYDKVYTRTMNLHKHKNNIEIRMNNEPFTEIAERIIANYFANNL